MQVTFNQAADVELAVTQGKNKVSGKFAWSNDNKTATFKADAKLRKGTYTVTATSKSDADFKAEGTVEVKDQYVKEIVISDDVALTGDERKSAHVFYDVLDQYGESVRNTTSITWTSSTSKKPVANRTTGEITLAKKDAEEEFRFGEKVYLTGVDAKTGVSVQKELTIGQPRSLDQLNVAGFVKKGTSEIVEGLPAGFKSDEYYMAFQAVDQNENYMSADNYEKADITFVSDNPLLIEKLEVATPIKTLVMGGEEYAVAEVTPGMNVDQGGEVNITAIASKTGNKTVKNIVVGVNTSLAEFDMLEPAGIIAEGEDVEIDFVARDQNGEKITNFNTLARKSGVKTLQFNAASGANLVLEEQQDGTAKLVYKAEDIGWNKSRATDGIDQPISLTSIVIGGNTSNLMLSVQDKARPVGIKSIDMENALVHEGTAEVKLANNVDDTDFVFVDQYGRTMDSEKMTMQAYKFFKTAEAGNLKGTEFAGYRYFIQATYKGAKDLYSGAKFNDGSDVSGNLTNNAVRNLVVDGADNDSDVLTLSANLGDAPTAVTSGMAMNFEIARQKGSEEVESVSPVKTEALSIINIAQVSDITVDEVGKVYIPTKNSGKATGATVLKSATPLTATEWETEVAELDDTPTGGHVRELSLSGKYNNEKVTIPAAYYDVSRHAKSTDALTAVDTNSNNLLKIIYGSNTEEISLTEKDYDGEEGNTLADLVADINAKLQASTNLKDIQVRLDGNKIVFVAENEITFIGASGTDVLGVLDGIEANNTTTLVNTQGKLTFANTDGKLTVTGATEALLWKDLYNITTAQYLRKDASQRVTVSILRDPSSEEVLTTASKTLTISDAAPTLTRIDAKDTWLSTPDTTRIADLGGDITGKAKYLDQYDIEVANPTLSYRVSNVVENKDGYVLNNFSYTGNNSANLVITGAERNDEFVVTVEATGGNSTVTKDINVTVAPDAQAKLDTDKNHYLETLLPKLEEQRTTLNK